MRIESLLLKLLSATILLLSSQYATGQNQSVDVPLSEKIPLVIAHRGASGYLPEHTLAAYSTAVIQGADYIELDLVSTRDGQLIARHDNELNLTTNIADHVDFADRRTEKIVDGRTVKGWFSEDFSLEEIRRLRAIERIPGIRPANTRFNGQFTVPTLEEAISLIKKLQKSLNREIGLYIELKHSTYFDQLGLTMEEVLVQSLRDNGYNEFQHKVFLQSFEISSLRSLNAITNLKLIQLLGNSGQPYDERISGSILTYADMATAQGLREIAVYADGVGPEKYHYLIPQNERGELKLENKSDFVTLAHAAGLLVHPYTFRAENEFLPNSFQTSTDPAALGSAAKELDLFLQLGIDGFFTDHTDIGVAVRDRYVRNR